MYVFQLKFRTKRNPLELADRCRDEEGGCLIMGPGLCPFGKKPCSEVTPEDWEEIYLGTELLPLEDPKACPPLEIQKEKKDLWPLNCF